MLSNTLIWRCLALLALVLMAWAGFRPDPLPQYTDHFDKWVHGIAFAGITITFLLAFPRWHWLFILSALVALGFGIEIGQDLYLPKRTFDWEDFAVDTVGVIVGAILIFAITRYVKPYGRKESL
ncbi:VanZ family protein [Aestuariicella hydrocarbonica]|uniref:VanZ family protein n=1 Tax=Pseudomaricurvus hydrocarbonicus TaxID=1470433 RepID=A0A9E5MQD8_9GAMM|nr:VanZ family protein [Aestuariicella hydrocarbonica]NHO68526.1 VanZ family protein [Aestuariicella hydrocarbonica]